MYTSVSTTRNNLVGDYRDNEGFKQLKLFDKPELERIAQFASKISSKAACTKDYQFHRFVGNGEFGLASTIIDAQGKEWVLKIQRVRKDGSFKLEINTMKRFSSIGIGVTVKSYCYVKLGKKRHMCGLIVMEKIDGTLIRLLDAPQSKETLDSIGEQLVSFVSIMDRENISHNDLHFSNIGYVLTSDNHGNDIVTLKLIDFGWGSYVRSFTDVSILNIGRAIFKGYHRWPKDIDDYKEIRAGSIPNYEYLEHAWWPRLQALFYDKSLLNTKQDFDSLDDAYVKLFDEQVQPLQFVPRHDPDLSDQPPINVISNLVSNASCTNGYERPVPHLTASGLFTITKKKDIYSSHCIKIELIENTKRGDVYWEGEVALCKRYYYEILLYQDPPLHCKEFVKSTNELYGILWMDNIEHSLDYYLDQNQDTMKSKDIRDIESQLFSIIDGLERCSMTYGDLGISKIGLRINSRGKIVLIPFDFRRGSIYRDNSPLEILSLGKSLANKSGKAYDYIKKKWESRYGQRYGDIDGGNLHQQWQTLYDKFEIDRLISTKDIQNIQPSTNDDLLIDQILPENEAKVPTEILYPRPVMEPYSATIIESNPKSHISRNSKSKGSKVKGSKQVIDLTDSL
jgi:hypothetical protein